MKKKQPVTESAKKNPVKKPEKKPLKTLAKVLTRATRPGLTSKKGRKHDPELIEQVSAAYRSGVKIVQISDAFGVPEKTIKGWASKYEWKIDLRDRINREAQRKILAGGIDDDAIVDAASNEIVMMLSRHASVLKKHIDIIEVAQKQLLDLLEPPKVSPDSLDIVGSKQEEIFLPQKVAVAKMLVEASSKVISDQRKHYKVDSAEDSNRSAITDWLAEATARM